MLLDNMTTFKPATFKPAVLFILILAVIVMVPPGVMLKYWHTKTETLEEIVRLYTQKAPQEILYQVEAKLNLLSPWHLSTTKLARSISSSVNETQLSIPDIMSKVAPLLFQAFSTIPYISQVTFIRRDGLLFSYSDQGNQKIVAVYTNASLISVDEEFSVVNHNLTCYSQPANRDTGKLYGVVTSHTPSTLLDPSVLKVILESTNGTASIVTSWINNEDLMFLNTAIMDGKGAISLGFEAKAIIKSLSKSISNGGSLFLGTKDGQILSDVEIPYDRIVIVDNNSIALKLLNQNDDQVGDIACNLSSEENDGIVQPTTITILETKYDVYCSHVEILGVKLVLVLVMPFKGLDKFLNKYFHKSYQYLLGNILLMFPFTAFFVVIITEASKRVRQLRFAMKKLVVATSREEKKRINKNTNYANASHDARVLLEGITGLIEKSLTQIDQGSNLEASIILMKNCSQDLLDIMENIRDKSTLEARKMTLEKEEFVMSELLEDVADLFHVVGMKKGVDVVLDLSDGSINKFDQVIGDRGKLKQILSNLLSNAVKFTSEGCVSIRAYARKPNFSSSLPYSTQKGHFSWLSCFHFQQNKAYNDYKMNVDDDQKDENCMKFVFEVDDTGLGIPKDKQQIVFENYAQIKDTSARQEGTGLGLGIVQSLVCLMGGEIEIVDKEAGKKGTCFKFSAYLPICETYQRASNARNQFDAIESEVGAYMSSGEFLSTQTHFSSASKEGSQVVLFIQNDERRKVCKNFMERNGIKVLEIKNHEELSSFLMRIRHKRVYSPNSSSKKSDTVESSGGLHGSRPRSKQVSLGLFDGIEQEMPHTHHSMTSTIESVPPNFVLIVIDTTGVTFPKISRVITEYRMNIAGACNRVVWLDMPRFGNLRLHSVTDGKIPLSDIIISKPLHGSRLYQLLTLLPEFGGEMPGGILQAYLPNSSTSEFSPITTSSNLSLKNVEIKEVDKLLSGKKVLLVEDELVQQTIADTFLSGLGAHVDKSVDGQEALERVRKGLQDLRTSGTPDSLPYDYIFMDCQMPLMDGIEATRKIREEEEKYGVHMPIFAVSAHTTGPEIELMKEAGADYNLSKPVNAEKIVNVVNIFED